MLFKGLFITEKHFSCTPERAEAASQHGHLKTGQSQEAADQQCTASLFISGLSEGAAQESLSPCPLQRCQRCRLHRRAIGSAGAEQIGPSCGVWLCPRCPTRNSAAPRSEASTNTKQNECGCALTGKTVVLLVILFFFLFCFALVQQRQLHTRRTAVSIVADGQLQEMGHCWSCSTRSAS